MGPYSLSFNAFHEYDPGREGITVEVLISANRQRARLHAKIDTGAQHCIFHRFHGESLGLEVEKGHPQRFHTATGQFLAYGHNVTLSVLGLEFDSMVYFAADESFPRNVLGRYGWLQQVRLGLIDYEGKLYLSSYND